MGQIRVKKNGASDDELREHLELILKALDPTKHNKVAFDETRNPAMRTIHKQANKAYDKMVSGILGDVKDIINERL